MPRLPSHGGVPWMDGTGVLGHSWRVDGRDGSEWVRERWDSTGPGLLGISSHRSVFTLRTAKQPSVAGLILRAPHFNFT